MDSNGNGHHEFGPTFDRHLTEKEAEDLLDSLEKDPKCLSCGASTGSWVTFCGACGTENPAFDTKSFQEEMGAALEDIKKQEGCGTGHLAAKSDKDRSAKYCIYCGREY